ncbi:hypothetical protein FEM54_03445 [Pseudomonas edaphica]|uniref:Uncharacterized protein n=1 Tax=Pseudomonas edaphica TaxID=2006980 RepID=A0ABY2UFS2_9PSED|nr:hypothetical protein FEM54_03445 [Pseudomonas edaphica]
MPAILPGQDLHQHERYSCKTRTCSKSAQVCYDSRPPKCLTRVAPCPTVAFVCKPFIKPSRTES